MAARRAAVQARRTAQTGPELIEQWMHRIGTALDRQVATLRSRMRAGSRKGPSGMRAGSKPGRSRLAVGRKRRSRSVVRGGRKTRAELYEMARKRGLPGRSKMRRDELARRLRQR